MVGGWLNSIAVVSPPCTIARSQAARCRYRLGTKPRTSSPSCTVFRLAGSMRGPVTAIMAAAEACVSPGKGLDHLAQQGAADTGSADCDNADDLVRVEAKLLSQRLAVRQFGGVETGDVSAEIEVGFGPFTDGWQVLPEGIRTMSAGLPTKIERSRRRG